MELGYFASLTQSMYRQTRDDRRVVAMWRLPLLRHRYYLLPDAARVGFERRVKQAHIAALAMIFVGVKLISDPDPTGLVVFFALMTVLVTPAMQAWMSRGLSAVSLTKADLEPVSALARRLSYARAAGEPTLWALLVVSALLVIPQAYVAATDGAWWAWLGVLMFGASVVYFGRLLLRLRQESGAPRAT